MGYKMIEFIDNQLNSFFSDRAHYAKSPFNVEDFRDCTLFEIIKEAYGESEKKKSLRAHRQSDADDLRMRDSRWISYAQHYRKLQYERVKERTGKCVSELLPDDVDSMSGKLTGHLVTDMQYFELKTMSRLPILKAVINKRICDVKKISNEQFIQGMHEYDSVIDELLKLLDGNTEDVLFATIALYTLEWKYNIELFYNCAVEAEKNKVKEVPINRLALLCAVLYVLAPSNTVLPIESRFVLHRRDLVPYMYEANDEDWEAVKEKFYQYFIVKYYVRKDMFHNLTIPQYVATHISRETWADFIREHYNLRNIYKTKEWNNKRIRYFRKMVQAMIRDVPEPRL